MKLFRPTLLSEYSRTAPLWRLSWPDVARDAPQWMRRTTPVEIVLACAAAAAILALIAL